MEVMEQEIVENANLFGLDDWVWIAIRVGLIIVAIFVFKIFASKIVDKVIRKTITSDKYASEEDEKRREDTLISIVNAVLKISVWVFGLMLILSQLGVNIAPLIAGAGVLGLAVGFGAQTVVQDFLSGLFIILDNQYRIGDVVTLAGITGTVEYINIRQTVLRDFQGHKHYIPHSKIDTTSNLTMDFSKLVLKIEVAYGSDIEKIKKIVNEIGVQISKDKEFKDDIMEVPEFIRINDFGLHAIVVLITGKVTAGSQWSIAGEMRARIKYAFEKENIEIPFQQLVVHKT